MQNKAIIPQIRCSTCKKAPIGALFVEPLTPIFSLSIWVRFKPFAASSICRVPNKVHPAALKITASLCIKKRLKGQKTKSV